MDRESTALLRPTWVLQVKGRKQGSIEVITLVGILSGLKSADDYAWDRLENTGQKLENSLFDNIKKHAIEYGKKFGYWKKVGTIHAKWRRGQKTIELHEDSTLDRSTTYGLKHMGLYEGTTGKFDKNNFKLHKPTKQNANDWKSVSVYTRQEVVEDDGKLIYEVKPDDFPDAEGCTECGFKKTHIRCGISADLK